ncbi:MAG: c-type cytochrome [Methylomarinum sp.]|nr:c-type cytochrome [Methylomarinum sp.]
MLKNKGSFLRFNGTNLVMKGLNSISLISWLLWHFMSVLTIVLIPSQFFFGDSLWNLPKNQINFLTGLSLSYLISVLLLTIAMYKCNILLIRDKLLIVLAVFGSYSFLLLMTKEFYSRPYLLLAVVLSAILISLSFWVNKTFQKIIIVFFIVLSSLMQFLGSSPSALLFPGPLQYRVDKKVDTDLYSIKVSFFEKYFCSPLIEDKCITPRNGGGISAFGNDFLLATGDGFLYLITLDKNKNSIETKLLPYKTPMNSEDFKQAGYKENLALFRTTDILVQDKADGFRLFAAHHYYNTVDGCFSIRVSSIEGRYNSFIKGLNDLKWQTVYETEPCLPLIRPFPKSHSARIFSGDESGGRLLLLNENSLMLSTGDHLFNGWDKAEMLAQDKNTSYGKTINIDLNTGVGKVYSMGHRNPQGLFADSEGTIWLTEHGPRGGDELNLLDDGANYGWPLVTYGTDYRKHLWPLNKEQGQHIGFHRPIYSWVPSIAISNLVGVEGKLFELWKHDLLIASYTKTIWRVRVREGRVVYAEPIKIRGKNARIRDIIEDKDGRIILWLDSGAIVVLEPALKKELSTDTNIKNNNSPKELFVAYCAGCHSVEQGGDGIGPNLFDIVNRQIASVTGYNYSEALTRYTGIWSEKELDSFIANPQYFAHGTSMDYAGMSKQTDRIKIIDYLKTLN